METKKRCDNERIPIKEMRSRRGFGSLRNLPWHRSTIAFYLLLGNGPEIGNKRASFLEYGYRMISNMRKINGETNSCKSSNFCLSKIKF